MHDRDMAESDLERKNRLCREASEAEEVGDLVTARRKLEAAATLLNNIPSSVRRGDRETRFDRDWISSKLERIMRRIAGGRRIKALTIRRTTAGGAS